MTAEAFQYGIVRTGRDPQMVMQEGSEAAPAADAATTSEPVQGTVSEVGAPVAATAETASTEPTASEIKDDPKWDEDTRKYIEGLRGEAAKHRTRANQFEETFKEWPAEAVEGFLSLAKAIESEDPAAVPVLQNLLKGLSPEEAAAVTEALAEAGAGDAPPEHLTREEAEKWLEEKLAERETAREAEAAEAAQLEGIKTEIEGLGYNLDAPNEEATLLFHFANLQEGDGPKDFKKAHEAVEAMFQKRIDNYIGRVGDRNSRYAKKAAATGLTPAGVDGGVRKLNLQDGSTRKAMQEFLDSAE